MINGCITSTSICNCYRISSSCWRIHCNASTCSTCTPSISCSTRSNQSYRGTYTYMSWTCNRSCWFSRNSYGMLNFSRTTSRICYCNFIRSCLSWLNINILSRKTITPQISTTSTCSRSNQTYLLS